MTQEKEIELLRKIIKLQEEIMALRQLLDNALNPKPFPGVSRCL